MKKVLFLCASLLVGSQGLKAQVPEPVLGVNFTSYGITLSGSDLSSGSHTAGTKSECNLIYDRNTSKYLGSTSNNINSYYYVTYDANDKVGAAFANDVTWEFVFRLDKQEAFDPTTVTYNDDAEKTWKSTAGKSSGTSKFFSSQQSGGWCFRNYSNTGLSLDYVHSATSGDNTYVTPGQLFHTGKFYHVVATKSKTTGNIVIYVNGKKLSTTPMKTNAFRYPGIGTTTRSKGMWFNLGGDPGDAVIGGTEASQTKQGVKTPGTYCEASAQTTWLYANIYNSALSDAQVASLYTEDVKHYTEPKKPAQLNELILDAVFEANGNAHDASPYKSLTKVGSPTTQYNSTLKRFEMSNPAGVGNTNFYYTYYGTTPSVSSQLGDAYSLEYYACADPATNNSKYASMAALSGYQGGGIGSHQSVTSSDVPYTTGVYGWHAAVGSYSAGCKSWGGGFSAKGEFTKGTYDHYVLVRDRLNCVSQIWKNGIKIADQNVNIAADGRFLNTYDDQTFPRAAFQWFAVGGDAGNANVSATPPTTCDFPWQGQIATARIWGKGLTEDDITSLYAQATATSKNITLDANGYATACVPFAATIPVGVTAYIVSSQNNSTVTIRKIANAGEVVANGVPVILKGTASAEITLEAADISAVTPKLPSGNMLDGSYIRKNITAGTAYKLTNGQFIKCIDETLDANTCFLAFEPGDADTKTIQDANAVSIPNGTALLDISFDADGIVCNGVEPHEANSYYPSVVKTIYDKVTDTYLGTTSNANNSYYYVKYDKDDALGTAFANAATWECLLRVDAEIDQSSSNPKLFSSQESGGWTLYAEQNYLRFGYVVSESATGKYTAKNTNTKYSTGKFYHIVATVDRTTNKLIYYVNGKNVSEVDLGTDAFRFPNSGTIARENGMWMCLGGDPNGATIPGTCQNSAQATFAFAKIYKGALSASQVSSLYDNPKIKHFTEPVMKNTEDLLLDAVFEANGNARDNSVYNDLVKAGNLQTQYNTTLKRYETVAPTTEADNSTNFFYREYGTDPVYTSNMGQAISYEVYCKPKSATPTKVTSPLSSQQSGGFGFEINSSKWKWNANTTAYTTKYVAGTGPITSETSVTTNYTHVVLTYDKKTLTTKIFVNGTEDKTATAAEATTMAKFPQGCNQYLIVGGDAGSASYSFCDMPFYGNIATARVWAKALTAEDAQTLYAQATATQETVNIDEYKYITRIFPFAAVVPAGLKAYVVESANGSVQLTEYATEGDVIPYGTPVILGSETTGNYTLEAADLTSATIKPAPATNLLEGSFATKDAAADGDMYILAVDNGQLVFAPVQGSTSITAQRAWLPKSVVKLAAAAKAMPIMAPGVTGVNGAKVSTSKENTYYDIQGRKVTNPTRGLYIKNGQKIWVK